MGKTPQFTMRLAPELREALEAIAARDRRSLSNVIELACLQFIEADRKSARRSRK